MPHKRVLLQEARRNSSLSKGMLIQVVAKVSYQGTGSVQLVAKFDIVAPNLNSSHGNLVKSELSPTVKLDVHGGVEIRKNSRLHHMLPPDILMLKGEVLRSAISHYEVDHMIHLANMRKQMYEKYCAKQSASIQSGTWKPHFSGLVMKGGSLATDPSHHSAMDGNLQVPPDVHIQRFLMRYKDNYKLKTTQESSFTKKHSNMQHQATKQSADSYGVNSKQAQPTHPSVGGVRPMTHLNDLADQVVP